MVISIVPYQMPPASCFHSCENKKYLLTLQNGLLMGGATVPQLGTLD
jgi:hypothetical protein